MIGRLQSSDERLRIALPSLSLLNWHGEVLSTPSIRVSRLLKSVLLQRVSKPFPSEFGCTLCSPRSSASGFYTIMFHYCVWVASEVNCTIWRACRAPDEVRGWKGLGRAQSWLVRRQCPCSLYMRWVKPLKYWVQDRCCPGRRLVRAKMRPCNVSGIPSKMPAAP